MGLRDYQVQALSEVESSMRLGRTLLVLPTGGGKTTVAAEVVRAHQQEGVVFLAHRKELIDQASERLSQHGIDHGVIAPSAGARGCPWMPVQVASIATMRARNIRPSAGLIIIDEAHRAAAKSYTHILDSYPTAKVLGLTATPWRLDGKPLGDLFQRSVVASTPAQLRDAGWLAPCVGYSYDVPDMRKVHKKLGDFADSESAQSMTRIDGSVVDRWLELAGRAKSVAFAVTIEHSKGLVARFRSAGVRAEHLDGSSSRTERARILADLASGRLELVSNVNVLTEGWDCPSVKCVVMARPTLSLGLYLQMIGRARRPDPGGAPARIHDHAGNALRHGLPDDDRDWGNLSVKSPSRTGSGSDAPGVRVCPECFAIYPPTMEYCPACGTVRAIQRREVIEVAGRLVEWEDVTPPPSLSAKQDYYCQVAIQAKTNGYKSGWADYRFKARFGNWPTALDRAKASG